MTTGDMLKAVIDFRTELDEPGDPLIGACTMFAQALIGLETELKPEPAKEKTDAGDFDPDDIPF